MVKEFYIPDSIKSSYIERLRPNAGDYSWFNADVCYYRHEKQRVLLDMLKRAKIYDLSTLKILEVGCGFGDNLLHFLMFGASPQNLYGNDILTDRIEIARHRLPATLNLFHSSSLLMLKVIIVK